MKTVAKVLACVDRSRFAEHVADYASWAAVRLDAPLEFLHVIDHSEYGAPGGDLSGTIGMDTQEHLLSELSGRDEEQSQKAREAGRVFLNHLRERSIAAGVPDPDVRQRHGPLDETLAEQQSGVRLFVMGRRGESAESTQRDLGRNLERMVRALRKPILAVTEGFHAPSRVMVAYDGGPSIRRGVELIATTPLLRGLPLFLLMSGRPRADGEKQMESATRTLTDAGYAVTGAIVPGDPERVIADAARERGIDLLVMGAYGHSAWRSLLFGSKTSGVLRSALVPTLLVR